MSRNITISGAYPIGIIAFLLTLACFIMFIYFYKRVVCQYSANGKEKMTTNDKVGLGTLSGALLLQLIVNIVLAIQLRDTRGAKMFIWSIIILTLLLYITYIIIEFVPKKKEMESYNIVELEKWNNVLMWIGITTMVLSIMPSIFYIGLAPQSLFYS